MKCFCTRHRWLTQSTGLRLGHYGLEVELDTTNFQPYSGGGLINQIKVEEHVSFVRILFAAFSHGKLMRPNATHSLGRLCRNPTVRLWSTRASS